MNDEEYARNLALLAAHFGKPVGVAGRMLMLVARIGDAWGMPPQAPREHLAGLLVGITEPPPPPSPR